MTRSDGIRLVTELEAARILESRGFTKERCVICDGVGHLVLTPAMELALSDEQRRMQSTRLCHNCEGAGWRWKAPESATKTA
jgi:hypothetical protein